MGVQILHIATFQMNQGSAILTFQMKMLMAMGFLPDILKAGTGYPIDDIFLQLALLYQLIEMSINGGHPHWCALLFQKFSNHSDRNMLIFVTPDKDSMETLEHETRRYLAWKSVIADAKALNLDEHQKDQATESISRSDGTVNVRLQAAYGWLLVPAQEGTEPMTWDTTRIAGGTENYVAKAAKKLEENQQLITRWSPVLLKMELDKWLWQDTPHIGVKKLWEYLCTYIYLSRLRDAEVLLDAIRDGVRSRDFFGYAAAVGEDGRYQGLVFGTPGGTILLDSQSVLVKPEVALKQQENEVKATEYTVPQPTTESGMASKEAVQPYLPEVNKERIFRRFHGSVALDPMRLGRDAGKVAEEVVQHMAGILGAKVEVIIEIQAEMPSGTPDHVVRTVTENCSTLKFKTYGFEEE